MFWQKLKPKTFLRIWNFWPPFLFNGIKLVYYSEDLLQFKVKIKLHFWNANYHGTQYGGAMSSATDPFYAIILIYALGKEYAVWDKVFTMRFLKPGKTDLFLNFEVTRPELEEIRQKVDEEGKMEWTKRIDLYDADGVIVAYADRTLSIKKKTSIPQGENR